ncbi:hypothetical protein DSO57_1023542 [Entomophthora muscae]|uniref:Uncharacterized protein n=1 Tax=Entomophthora muscae TaxID=34485 RepID=A0ACC2RTZ9_9FUNG|nr:hypothetical protein DSO57_1023542 [Entomophthora muscae]
MSFLSCENNRVPYTFRWYLFHLPKALQPALEYPWAGEKSSSSLVFYLLPNKKQDTYVCALTILKTKLDEILPTLEKQPNETRGQKKKTISQE